MACRGSFSSSYGENLPDSWDLDPDKPGFVTFCQGEVTNPAFSSAFLCFLSPIPGLLQPTLES